MVLDNIQHTTYTQNVIRTQVYLPEDLYNDVKLLSLSGEGNFSDLLREGLKTVIEAKAKTNSGTFAQWKSFIGAAKGGKRIDGVKAIRDYYENDVV